MTTANLGKSLNRFVLVAGVTATLAGCLGGSDSSKHGSVIPQLMKLSTSTGAAREVAYHSLSVSGLALNTLQVNSAITIAALKAPITEITLYGSDSKGSVSSVVYTCAKATLDDCMVDLENSAALTNLLSGAPAATVRVGTYDRVQVSNCKTSVGYYAKIKASGTYMPDGSGATYYTQSAAGLLTTDAGLWDETKVYFNGCSREYALPAPVTVADGGTVAVKLYFDSADIAFFGNPVSGEEKNAAYAGGYSFVYPTQPSGPFVSVGYLDVAGTVDIGTPTIERYRVNVTDANGMTLKATIGLYYTSNNAYFGGYTRSYWDSESNTGSNQLVTALKTYTANSDGVSYTLANYGGSANSAGWTFDNFRRADHSGTGTSTWSTPASAFSYTAVRLP